MASSRKYAELLDIDPEAPDIFETPDLTDDTSTIPTSTSPAPESSTEDIDHHRINADEARIHFLSTDERNHASATRIGSKRKGYRSNRNRRDNDGVEINGNGLSSDEEGEEGLARKLARLRREIAEAKGEEGLERKLARLRKEIAEAKGEIEQRKADKDGEQVKNSEETQDIEALSEILNTISPASGFGEEHGAASQLTKRLAAASSLPSAPPLDSTQTSQQSRPTASADSSATYTLTHAPSYDQTHTFSKITSFDTRLSALEAALGIDTLPLPTQDRPAAKAVLPTLETLDRQLATLTTSTDSSLETISRRIRQLTTDAQNLESARKAAKAAAAAQEEPSGSAPSAVKKPTNIQDPDDDDDDDDDATPPTTTNAALIDPETISKIHALYSTLPTIESLAPLLPATLDRLRSLRALHADAGTASQTLRRVEERQADVREEIKGWKEGLEKVEVALEEGGGRMGENTAVVEGWVRELEGRMEGLGGS